jgi:hypothetical protein
VVDPISQIPDPMAAPVSSRVQHPPKKRTVEPTLVLRNRQLDGLRAEVRRRQAAFKRQRFSSLFIWGLAGGAAVFGGAWLARGWDTPSAAADQGEATPAALNGQASRVSSVAASPAPRPTSASGTAAEPQPLEPAVSEPAAVTVAPNKPKASSKAPAARAPERPLSLDELPTK